MDLINTNFSPSSYAAILVADGILMILDAWCIIICSAIRVGGWVLYLEAIIWPLLSNGCQNVVLLVVFALFVFGVLQVLQNSDTVLRSIRQDYSVADFILSEELVHSCIAHQGTVMTVHFLSWILVFCGGMAFQGDRGLLNALIISSFCDFVLRLLVLLVNLFCAFIAILRRSENPEVRNTILLVGVVLNAILNNNNVRVRTTTTDRNADADWDGLLER